MKKESDTHKRNTQPRSGSKDGGSGHVGETKGMTYIKRLGTRRRVVIHTYWILARKCFRTKPKMFNAGEFRWQSRKHQESAFHLDNNCPAEICLMSVFELWSGKLKLISVNFSCQHSTATHIPQPNLLAGSSVCVPGAACT